jgi:hypothetical protein
MDTYSSSPEEEAEFSMVMTQARKDTFTLGISQRLKAYLEQFPPKERMQRILAIYAEVENQLQLCQRLLCIESEATPQETQKQSESLPNRSSSSVF